MAETLDFKLDAFEGPLDLLLQLIEKDKVDIYDIPISSITDQYLNYVAKMSEEDLGTLSDFLVMASTLLDIKARMLLPKETDEEGEEIDPRAELARRLQEYKEYKRVSQELGNWYQECEGIFYKEESIPEELLTERPKPDLDKLMGGISEEMLRDVFLSVLQRTKDRVDERHSDFGKIEREPVRIADKLSYVLKYGKKKKIFSFRSLLSKQKTRQEKDDDWDFVTKMTLIVMDLLHGNPKLKEMGFKEEALGHNAIAGGFQGQRQWTDWMPNGDFTETLLNTNFDWNGRREPTILATENDSLNGTAMLLAHLLTNLPQIFSDVRTYWSPKAVKRVTGKELTGKAAPGIIHLINSGATTMDGCGQSTDAEGRPVMKTFWEMTDEDEKKCLENSWWMPADRDYFRGGGYSIHFVSKGDFPATMMRINIVDGLGPVLQIAEGWVVNVDPEIHDVLDKRTDPTWPTTWFTPRLDPKKDAFKDVYSVMNNWGANHGAISYGHIGADMITLASMLRIPVCMHNVDDSKIFRPAAWNAFGMDKEGADFRACANFGPIYK